MKSKTIFPIVFILLLQFVFSFNMQAQNNVGIGITPRAGYKLDVNGHLNIQGDLFINTRRALRLDSVWTVAGGGNTSAGTGAGNILSVASLANTLYGYGAGNKLTGNDNVMIGANAGAASVSVKNSLFIGRGAGENNTVSDNMFIGAYAGLKNTSGNMNTFVGTYTGSDNLTGAGNAYLGWNSGARGTIASWNTFLGSFTGQETTIFERYCTVRYPLTAQVSTGCVLC